MGSHLPRTWVPRAGQLHLLTELHVLGSLPAHPNLAHPIACYTASDDVEAADIGTVRVVLAYRKADTDLTSFLVSGLFSELSAGRSACVVRVVMAGVTAAMKHLAACKIAHRDIRPGNVLISSSSSSIDPARLVVQLTDLGTGCSIDDCTLNVGGRKGLTAPEANTKPAHRGEPISVNPASDVWSAGILYVTMIW